MKTDTVKAPPKTALEPITPSDLTTLSHCESVANGTTIICGTLQYYLELEQTYGEDYLQRPGAAPIKVLITGQLRRSLDEMNFNDWLEYTGGRLGDLYKRKVFKKPQPPKPIPEEVSS